MTRRLALRSLELAFAAFFFAGFAHHVVRGEFRPLARQRPLQTRSLYAAERAAQATALYLVKRLAPDLFRDRRSMQAVRRARQA